MLANEKASFAHLMVTPTAQNLIRVFFLREEMKKLAGSGNKVTHVHVIGAGAMGGDIAAWCAHEGLRVTLADMKPEPIAAAIKRAAELFGKGRASHVVEKNPRHLNAEDATTIDAAEIAVDLAILDQQTAIGVLRGDYVQGGKYQGRRVLGSGINLTHLYYGKIPFIWYLQRDLGIVNKLYRGLAHPETIPDDVNGQTIEMPWIAVVEGFAIGGHCQYLLTMDYVLAARDAFMSLPARKEGIIPGAANLRLPRFTGDRIARQAIMNQRRFECDSPEGRLICDEVVEPADMDKSIERVVENLTGSGVVSAASNRRAFRVGQEPFDLFREYFAVYALEQAYCHFSPALISNLEMHWNAKNRKL